MPKVHGPSSILLFSNLDPSTTEPEIQNFIGMDKRINNKSHWRLTLCLLLV